MREVYIDDESRDATVIVPDDQLALAIGKEGLNARLAARLTGWKVDIKSDTEFAQEEAEAAFAGEDNEEFTGRCAAILSNGKRCPNTALPGSRFCGVPAHRELAEREAGEDVSSRIVQPMEADEGGGRGGDRRSRGRRRGARIGRRELAERAPLADATGAPEPGDEEETLPAA